uniref:Enoyl-CoA delta isomerase 1, mitochondrial n=1 Tax=Stomoxys calcitrans TaxID=35570 RepID=A0A1I8Q897_STOCA
MKVLRQIFNNLPIRPIKQNWRCLSSLPVIDVKVDKKGIATLNMNKPPVNVLSTDMLLMLKSEIKELEKNKCRGLILTSANKSVFSAGLDLKELYKPDEQRLREYYALFQETWLAWYGAEMPTAALINGHAPAGGCVISTCCDYRVMLPNFTIGVNEVQFGVIIPIYVQASVSSVLPKRIAEIALTQGKLYTSAEALQVGFVDELADTKQQGLDKCLKYLAAFEKVTPKAATLTKLQFRARDLEEFHRERKRDLDKFVKNVTDEETQQVIGEYVDSLHNKQKK